MQEINFSNSNLTSLPNDLQFFPSLRTINVTGNPFQNIPQVLFNLINKGVIVENFEQLKADIASGKFVEVARKVENISLNDPKLIKYEVPKPAIQEAPKAAPKPIVKSTSSDTEKKELLANLFSISERVNLNDVASILDMNRFDLMKKLIEWRKMFEFKIDGDYLKVATKDIANLVNLLDSSYDKWGSKG